MTNGQSEKRYFLPFLVTAFLAGAAFLADFAALPAAAFTDTGLAAFAAAGLAFVVCDLVAAAFAGALVDTLAPVDPLAVTGLVAFADALVVALALVFLVSWSTLAPPKAAAQPSE